MVGMVRMVWGTYLEKNCPSSKGHLLVFGVSKPCNRYLGNAPIEGSFFRLGFPNGGAKMPYHASKKHGAKLATNYLYMY